jgi:hypothetical protein
MQTLTGYVRQSAATRKPESRKPEVTVRRSFGTKHSEQFQLFCGMGTVPNGLGATSEVDSQTGRFPLSSGKIGPENALRP